MTDSPMRAGCTALPLYITYDECNETIAEMLAVLGRLHNAREAYRAIADGEDSACITRHIDSARLVLGEALATLAVDVWITPPDDEDV